MLYVNFFNYSAAQMTYISIKPLPAAETGCKFAATINHIAFAVYSITQPCALKPFIQ